VTGDMVRFLEEDDEGECLCLREGGGDVGRYSCDGRYGWSSFVRFTDLAVCDPRQRPE
jgi:hypothetical protein